jgi:hypothetical protein
LCNTKEKEITSWELEIVFIIMELN